MRIVLFLHATNLALTVHLLFVVYRYKIDVTENLLPSPKSLYAHSKIIGEELIKAYCKLYKIKFNIIRFFNVCGIDQRDDFVITRFAKQIKKGTFKKTIIP